MPVETNEIQVQLIRAAQLSAFEYLDADLAEPVGPELGDTLAVFVREEILDCTLGVDDPLEAAEQARYGIDRALEQLEAVAEALAKTHAELKETA